MLALDAVVEVEPAAAGTRWLEAFAYDDCSEIADWIEADDDARRSVRRQKLLVEVRAAAQGGELDRALRQADELLALDRESEEAYRVLMEVFYLRGDRAAAIDVWDRCRTMLRGLYGVPPSAATQRLGQTILDSDSAPAMRAGSVIPVTVLRPPRLIGRLGMVATLVGAWRVGDAVCVSGEGGVGKSRLLGEFVAAVGPAAVASARPGDAMSPYASLGRLVLSAIERFQPPLEGPSTDAAVRLLPQIAAACGRAEPEPLRTAHERAQALDGLADLLRACVDRGCAAFVFDDLQFADPFSVQTLQALVERGADADGPCPSRLAFGSRDDELGPAARALLASLESARRLVRTTLDPLAENEVLELLQSLALPGFDAVRQAARLRRRVGGNPAFLLESVKLIAALGELDGVDRELPIPPGIEAVVERRLSLLSPAARHIAELASVAAESFSVDLAGRALALSLAELAEPLRELEARQVLYGRQLVHDIVASAVRRNVSAAVAERLHRFVAEQLETSGGEPAVIAGHWMACAEWQRAGDCFMAASTRARDAVRPADQALLLDAAADAYARCGAQAARFEALQQRQQISGAPDYLARREAMLEGMRTEAVTELQRLHVLLAEVSFHADHLRSDTLAQAEQGVVRAEALGLRAMAFRFAQAVAWQHAGKGDPVAGLAAMENQRAWVFAQDDPAPRVRYHSIRVGVLGLTNRVGEAIEEAEQALSLLEAPEDALTMLPFMANLGLLRSWRGEFEAARRVLVEAIAMRDRLHGRGTGLLFDVYLGAVLRDMGRYAEALAILESARSEYSAQLATEGERTDLVVVENQIAQLWLLVGRHDLAEQALVTDASATEMPFRARRLSMQVRVARIARRPDEPLRQALEALIDGMPISLNGALATLELARSQPPAAALARLSALCETVALVERPGLLMHATTLMAVAAHAGGDAARARQHVDRLLELELRFLPFDIDPREMWRAMHAVLASAGDATSLAVAAGVAARSADWLRTVRERGLPEGTERSHAALQPPLPAA